MRSSRRISHILWSTTFSGFVLVAAISGAARQSQVASNAASPEATQPAASRASPQGPPVPGGAPQAVPTPASPMPAAGLNIVVLDPAHGGTDQGARGTEGITESDEVLQFAAATKTALEAQGFQVMLTRQGNDNPSFDDRSARANAQRGAVFISLHIASTGLPGTARVYVEPDVSRPTPIAGLIPWDEAQLPFLNLSHKLGDLVQQELAKRFKGSPDILQTAPVRQLRTTAAPAIAVEISSVSVQNRADLEGMIPGVAEAIARGAAAFRPAYVVPGLPVVGGSPQP
ncbi:MAG TPA: N-acetylmuramoyl-L-alanine amidase [Candidatus Eisenbacteria bacterium]|nr:N-acetylmuramoyl-L-alanine amidase [Candidatus Eisenbacteria bacterium]